MRKALVAFTSFLFVIGTIGSNIGPALVDENPMLILAMSARGRNLFGAIPYIDPLPFFVIGFIRLLLAATALYFVGRLFGEKALSWTESQVGEMPRIYKWTEKVAVKSGWLAVLLMPGSNIVCLLVGHLKMPPRRFFPLIVSGIMLRMTIVWFGGKQVEDQIKTVVDFIGKYQWWVVGGLFAISLLKTTRRQSPKVGVDDVAQQHDQSGEGIS